MITIRLLIDKYRKCAISTRGTIESLRFLGQDLFSKFLGFLWVLFKRGELSRIYGRLYYLISKSNQVDKRQIDEMSHYSNKSSETRSMVTTLVRLLSTVS